MNRIVTFLFFLFGICGVTHLALFTLVGLDGTGELDGFLCFHDIDIKAVWSGQGRVMGVS